jgi:hypothetical protein
VLRPRSVPSRFFYPRIAPPTLAPSIIRGHILGVLPLALDSSTHCGGTPFNTSERWSLARLSTKKLRRGVDYGHPLGPRGDQDPPSPAPSFQNSNATFSPTLIIFNYYWPATTTTAAASNFIQLFNIDPLTTTSRIFKYTHDLP